MFPDIEGKYGGGFDSAHDTPTNLNGIGSALGNTGQESRGTSDK